MESSEELTPALKKAQQAGIDLTLLYERLSWRPTERIPPAADQVGPIPAASTWMRLMARGKKVISG
jgi:hypothetical protein